MGKTRETPNTYEPMDAIEIPEDIPEIGLKAGTMGTIDTVYDGGRMLLVDVSSPTPPSALVDVRVDPEPRVVGYFELIT